MTSENLTFPDQAGEAELRERFAAMQQIAAAPSGKPGVMAALAPRFGIFPQPERSEGEWRVWWADYTDALGDLPAIMIDDAMRAYIRQPDAEFFPKAGPLRALAITRKTDAVRMYERARIILESLDFQRRSAALVKDETL